MNIDRSILSAYYNGKQITGIAAKHKLTTAEVKAILEDQGVVLYGNDIAPNTAPKNFAVKDSPRPSMSLAEVAEKMRNWRRPCF